MLRRRPLAALGTAVALAGLGAGAHGRRVRQDLAEPHDLHGTPVTGSTACRKCHPDHDRSWRRTFHRTMTREATPATVAGDFGGAHAVYGAVTTTFERDATGGYRMRFDEPGHTPVDVTVERTVGSRRYQQYLGRRGDTFFRLPFAWHVEERRWLHMNGAFLFPDPPDDPSAADEGTPGGRALGLPGSGGFDRHVVRWNDNCVFCHNVRPDPGLDEATGAFHTTVGELGVACEACHGPGDAHAAANRDPMRRAVLAVGGGADPTIVNPSRLSPARAADLCGRCHGQRITDDVGRFLAHGDPFVPGDDLALWSAPLWQDTTLGGQPDVFAARFWPDGTARLSAYEYQGLLQSPCAQRGALTCTTCHAMHAGDPRGQIAPWAEGDAACVRCHDALRAPAARAAHTHHDPAGAGAACVGCHMPRIVYGVLDVHRSHRIELPDPARAARQGRPDACALCHVDENAAWMGAAWRRWWGPPPAVAAEAHPDASALADGPLDEAPATARAALGGDPIERAVAVDALGRTPVRADARRSAARLGLLFDVMDKDDYPAVRRLAWRAARRLLDGGRVGLSHEGRLDWMAFDPTGPRSGRRAAVTALTAALPPGTLMALDARATTALRATAKAAAIEIGE